MVNLMVVVMVITFFCVHCRDDGDSALPDTKYVMVEMKRIAFIRRMNSVVSMYNSILVLVTFYNFPVSYKFIYLLLL